MLSDADLDVPKSAPKKGIEGIDRMAVRDCRKPSDRGPTVGYLKVALEKV